MLDNTTIIEELKKGPIFQQLLSCEGKIYSKNESIEESKQERMLQIGELILYQNHQKVLVSTLQIRIMQKIAKVTFKNITKTVSFRKQGYIAFIQKLKESFQLSPDQYYHLYFINQHDKDRSITSEEDLNDFYLCPFQTSHKLDLERTENVKLHFEGNPSNVSTAYENNEELEKKIKSLKDQVILKLQKFKEQTREKIAAELKERSDEKRIRRGASNNTIHYGIECCSCRVDEIQGVRFECAICDYNLCEICEGNGYEHTPTHPLIKIKDETQMLLEKNNRLKSGSPKKETKKKEIKKEEIKQAVNPQLVQRLMGFTGLSEPQAIDFIKLHPKKQLQELANIYYDTKF